MDWRGRRTSDNIEDRRRMGPARVGGIGIVGLLIVIVVGMVFGVDISPLLQGGGMVQTQAPSGPNAIDDDDEAFVGVVLAETEDIWGAMFRQSGLDYTQPRLVLFSGATGSACGAAQSAMGPFYCPNDQTVYLDTDFFQVMSQQLGARGEFARAYVIAHEVGHHVQDELGLLGQVNAERARMGKAESNALSVRVELQADCYAGIWAREATRPARDHRPGHPRRAGNRRPHRRRRPAARERRAGGSRQLHPRKQRTAPDLVLPGLQDRRSRGLRHLLHQPALARWRARS